MHAEAGLLHGAPPGCCWCCEGGPPVISRCCNSAAKLPGFRIIQQALFSVRAGIPRIGSVEMGGWTREFCLASQHAKLGVSRTLANKTHAE